jgi:hypothetical protein
MKLVNVNALSTKKFVLNKIQNQFLTLKTAVALFQDAHQVNLAPKMKFSIQSTVNVNVLCPKKAVQDCSIASCAFVTKIHLHQKLHVSKLIAETVTSGWNNLVNAFVHQCTAKKVCTENKSF